MGAKMKQHCVGTAFDIFGQQRFGKLPKIRSIFEGQIGKKIRIAWGAKMKQHCVGTTFDTFWKQMKGK